MVLDGDMKEVAEDNGNKELPRCVCLHLFQPEPLLESDRWLLIIHIISSTASWAVD